MKPITDFDLFSIINLVMKKSAVTDQRAVGSHYHSKLRGQAGAVPAQDFFQKCNRLLARKRAERKTHKVGIGHELGKKIDVFLAERSENQAQCIKNHR